tara:strand:- start:6469 stop:6624 length:156 start_codon:yes stop_codon:yes gene_type:complete
MGVDLHFVKKKDFSSFSSELILTFSFTNAGESAEPSHVHQISRAEDKLFLK